MQAEAVSMYDERVDWTPPSKRETLCYLIPETTVYAGGCGPVVYVGEHRGKLLVLTLCLHRVVEREFLAVSIWGSVDGVDWIETPLASFSKKYYCGLYSILLNLNANPDVNYLRAEWQLDRWSKNHATPVFDFNVFIEESGARVPGGAAPGSQAPQCHPIACFPAPV
jgi:hypothetical protein